MWNRDDISKFRGEKILCTSFDVLGFVQSEFEWFSDKIDYAVGRLRESFAGERKFFIISYNKKAICYGDKYGEYISSYIEVSSRASDGLFMWFSLKESCEINDTHIDGKYRGHKENVIISNEETLQSGDAEHQNKKIFYR